MGHLFCWALAYGLLSGSCTFGFIAPILAIITVQQQVLTGVLIAGLGGLFSVQAFLVEKSAGWGGAYPPRP